MKLLAVSLCRHDNSMAYFDGSQLHYSKLERIRQVKRCTFSTPFEWVQVIKDLWNVSLEDIDDIIVDFHVDNFYYFDSDTLQGLPPEIQDVLCGKQNVVRLTPQINPLHPFINRDVWYTSHHYAHSLSSWMLCKNYPRVNIVIDGMGDLRSWSVFVDDKLVDRGRPNNGSIGGSMADISTISGIPVSGMPAELAGKGMGLQSYGNIENEYLNQLRRYTIKDINEIFSFDNWVIYKKDIVLAENSKLNWFRTVHTAVGELLVNFFKNYASSNDEITYSGGVAQNVIWNTELKKTFPKLIIPPHACDEGLALGSIEWLRKKHNLPPFQLDNFPYIQSDRSPETNISQETLDQVVDLLVNGKTVGWYHGNGEVGPRALGNRSILMDPRNPNGKEIINLIKKREFFRPFGASVLKEHADHYFADYFDDQFMLFSAKANTLSIPSVTHVDGTCRVQMVSNSSHPFRLLLEKFYERTGCPVLLNTSLNVAGKPIAAHPESAIQLLITTTLDAVCVGNFIYQKSK